ncbi:ABC transporter permease [Bacteroidia bacterium]|nr:ABC transporter permease [Bacteroidia bacterium]
MIKHYLTVAFRNLRKYKSQSIISIVGLAVGFTCFALSSLWIRYEMTYDTFHKDAERIYFVTTYHKATARQSNLTPYPLASYLQNTFPEVELAINVENVMKVNLVYDEIYHDVFQAGIDSSFLHLFDVELIAGNYDFLIEGADKIAITEILAKKLFGKDDPLGKEVSIYSRKTVCAIIKSWSKHTNLPFDVLCANRGNQSWLRSNWETFIKLKAGIDGEAFAKKLSEHTVQSSTTESSMFFRITTSIPLPLTTFRYNHPAAEGNISLHYIILFALIGCLVIICSLVNYFTLFAVRLRIKERELALRKICGASGQSLFTLLSVEFLLTLFTALLLGIVFIQLIFRPFRELSDVSLDFSEILLESSFYIGAIIVFSLCIFILMIALFRKKSLNTVVRKGDNKLFRSISIVIQLSIGIGIIFCTVVLMKQIYYLHHTDLGINYKNTATIGISGVDSESLEFQLKQIPEITHTLRDMTSLIPLNVRTASQISALEDQALTDPQPVEFLDVTKEYEDFYGFRLMEGELLSDEDPKESVLVNETLVKTLNWKQPVGKTLKALFTSYMVKGVIQDFYTESPVIALKPFVIRIKDKEQRVSSGILFRYQGQWKSLLKKLEQMDEKEYAKATMYIRNAEETYNNYLSSENALMKLLGCVSLVCIILSVFGVFSLISLSCEEKRKEIAIRKINGATMRNILSIFFKTYFSLLIIGAVIAFPIGYYIMRQWLEQYVKQTDISAWIYLAIIFVMAFVIILCVGWRVYKASVENPAEVLKTE